MWGPVSKRGFKKRGPAGNCPRIAWTISAPAQDRLVADPKKTGLFASGPKLHRPANRTRESRKPRSNFVNNFLRAVRRETEPMSSMDVLQRPAPRSQDKMREGSPTSLNGELFERTISRRSVPAMAKRGPTPSSRKHALPAFARGGPGETSGPRGISNCRLLDEEP